MTTPLTEIGSVAAGHHAYLGAGKMRRGRRINLRSGYYTVQVRVTMIELSADKMGIATPAADCNAVTNAEPVAVGQIAVPIVTAHVAVVQVRPVGAGSRSLAPSAASEPVLAATML